MKSGHRSTHHFGQKNRACQPYAKMCRHLDFGFTQPSDLSYFNFSILEHEVKRVFLFIFCRYSQTHHLAALRSATGWLLLETWRKMKGRAVLHIQKADSLNFLKLEHRTSIANAPKYTGCLDNFPQTIVANCLNKLKCFHEGQKRKKLYADSMRLWRIGKSATHQGDCPQLNPPGHWYWPQQQHLYQYQCLHQPLEGATCAARACYMG